MRWFRARPRPDTPGRRPRDRRRVRDEASNSFALFIVMAPLILGAFGVGLDMSRNVYIKTELQNALDMATVAGAGVTKVSSHGNVVINPGPAIDATEKTYALNRVNAPGLSCWGTNTSIPGTHERRCWKVLDEQVNSRYLSYSVKERSTNAFLPIIGVKYQKYDLTSQARINQATE